MHIDNQQHPLALFQRHARFAVIINVTADITIANSNTIEISICLSKAVNHYGSNQFMDLSQLQKANDRDKTMIIKDSQASKKSNSPYCAESITPNLRRPKK